MKLWLVIAGVVGCACPCMAAAPSRFLAEYPAAVQALQAATKNISCSGSFKNHDSQGSIRFCKLGDERSWALKQYEVNETSLPWTRRVESFSGDWFFRLDGTKGVDAYEFKGVDFPASMVKRRAEQVEFRRWLRCNCFTCALYTVYGSAVNDLVNAPECEIVSEGPHRHSNLYAVVLKSDEEMLAANGRIVKCRLLFDPAMSWALVESDVMAEYTPGGPIDYWKIRAEPQRLADGSVVPKKVELWAGGVTENRDTVLGEPKWVDGIIHEVATFDKVVLGEMTEKDFLPSSFGLPDHLVVGTPPKAESNRWPWIAALVIVNAAALIWWTLRRRQLAAQA